MPNFCQSNPPSLLSVFGFQVIKPSSTGLELTLLCRSIHEHCVALVLN